MPDRVVEDRVHKDRDRFIESINEDDICLLASSYHNNDPCTFFKPPARGSYNICFFVRFRSRRNGHKYECEEGDSWVVRVPLSPCLAFGAHEKLESEVATMQIIAEKTTIPIPRVHAYSFAHEKGPYQIASFIILEYIEGRPLSDFKLKTLLDDQRRNLYEQLANIYIQLRRLEFPSIGALSYTPTGIKVQRKPVSIDTNTQELEGLQTSRIQAEYDAGALTSASDYVSMLLRIAQNAFEKSKGSVYDEEDGKETLYHLYQFSQFIEKKWQKPALDSGPFVLVHGDLHPYNLLVNDNMDIVALLDWEWSRVVPLQFFTPPTWLTNRESTLLSWPSAYSDYVDELDNFRAVVKDQELKMYSKELLLNDWARVHENGDILAAEALENWTDIDYFAAQYLEWQLHKYDDLKGRIETFILEDPARQELVTRKVHDHLAYQAEQERLEIKDSADNIQNGKDASDNQNTATAPLPTVAQRIALPWIRDFFRWWLEEEGTIMLSKTDRFLRKFALGGVTVVFLVGTAYIISKRNIRCTL